MPTIEEVLALAIRLGVVKQDELVGCTDEEIEALERELQIILPKAYKEFLLWGGKRAGELLIGSDWQYYVFNSGENSLVVFHQEARETLMEYNFPQTLPENAFAFLMHQGYMFYFFLVDEGDNPPIYFFCEGKSEISTPTTFRKEFCSFTEFLEYNILYHYLAYNSSVALNHYFLHEQYRPCNKSTQMRGN